MTRRRPLSTKTRLKYFLDHKGRCACCALPILPGKGWDIDHIIPIALGGDDTQDNMQLLCKACHGTKTAKRDVPIIAKVERIRAKHIGAKRTKRPMPCGRISNYKKDLFGRVFPRSIFKAR